MNKKIIAVVVISALIGALIGAYISKVTYTKSYFTETTNKNIVKVKGGVTLKADINANLNTCLEYMTTNYPGSTWILQDDSQGQGVYIKQWSSTMPKPTLEEAYAVWTDASSWKVDKIAEEKSNTDNWKTKQVDGETLADAIKALIICVNKRLPVGNKITAEEFKTELKDQLLQ